MSCLQPHLVSSELGLWSVKTPEDIYANGLRSRTFISSTPQNMEKPPLTSSVATSVWMHRSPNPCHPWLEVPGLMGRVTLKEALLTETVGIPAYFFCHMFLTLFLFTCALGFEGSVLPMWLETVIYVAATEGRDIWSFNLGVQHEENFGSSLFQVWWAGQEWFCWNWKLFPPSPSHRGLWTPL